MISNFNIIEDMANINRKSQTIATTNLDTATPEQKQKLIDNTVQAWQTLYKSVVSRKIDKIFDKNS